MGAADDAPATAEVLPAASAAALDAFDSAQRAALAAETAEEEGKSPTSAVQLYHFAFVQAASAVQLFTADAVAFDRDLQARRTCVSRQTALVRAACGGAPPAGAAAAAASSASQPPAPLPSAAPQVQSRQRDVVAAKKALDLLSQLLVDEGRLNDLLALRVSAVDVKSAATARLRRAGGDDYLRQYELASVALHAGAAAAAAAAAAAEAEEERPPGSSEEDSS
jgi:hypothetical protein